jgi:general secretion pathway protein A
MYNQHFGIDESPFSIAPDPRYLYMSDGHREALAHLLYGVQGNSGFVLLTGEVGTGKTTVCRCLLEQLPENTDIALILNPAVTALELLASICDELRITYKPDNTSIKVFVDLISAYLLDAHASGKKTVLIIDEAQNLAPPVLEQIRLLTNLETNRHKLLQIVMLGQPELLDKLARPDLRQLAQRITARYTLGPLARKDVDQYIAHRLAIAGLDKKLFSPSCINRLYKLTGGIPRLINIICDRALLGAYVHGEGCVVPATLARAAKEVLGENKPHQPGRNASQPSRWVMAGLAVLVVCGVALAAASYYGQDSRKTAPMMEEIPSDSANGVISPPAAHPSETPAVTAVSTPNQAVPEVLETPVATALEWPDGQPIGSSLFLGYRNLFQTWGLDYPREGNSDACRNAELSGLLCLNLNSNVDELIETNRPALLTLYNDDNEPFYGTIVNIDKGKATILLGPEKKVVPLHDLQRHWYGRHTILWHPPPGYYRPLQTGHTGPPVTWLAEQLAQIKEYDFPLADEAIFNESLRLRVSDFQKEETLVPDGVAGPRTLIRLNTLAGLDVPTLISNQDSE